MKYLSKDKKELLDLIKPFLAKNKKRITLDDVVDYLSQLGCFITLNIDDEDYYRVTLYTPGEEDIAFGLSDISYLDAFYNLILYKEILTTKAEC